MKCKVAILGTLLMLCLAFAASARDDYKKHPGYVDFEVMGIFGEVESTVEVFLKGPLLDLVAKSMIDEEPELSETISRLEYIHVQTFPLDDIDISRVEKKVEQVAKRLEKSGWEIVVRVRDREDDEHVYVYLLPRNDQTISGLVVMVIEDDENAVFVNIVGDINLKQIGRLGRKFDIDELDDIDWDEDWEKSKDWQWDWDDDDEEEDEDD